MGRRGWAAVLVVASGLFAAGCTGGSSPAPAAVPAGVSGPTPAGQQAEHYRLDPPENMVDGHWERDYDVRPPEPEVTAAMAGLVNGPTATYAVYEPVPKRRNDVNIMALTGFHGSIPDPDAARDELVRVLGVRDKELSVPVAPRTITPPGAREPVQCRVALLKTEGIGSLLGPQPEASCSWADASTVAKVTVLPLPTVQPADIDLDALAAEVVAIREAVRVR